MFATIVSRLALVLAFVVSPAWAQTKINLGNQAIGGASLGTGLIISNGTSALTAYAGTSCTNQFPRSLNASGAATCASVANTDLANSSITLNAGANVGITAPGAMSLGSTYTFGATSDTPRFAGLGLGGTAGSRALKIYGSSSGSVVLDVAAAAGTSTITLPGGTTDFSATGGTSQVVKQVSVGAALTVARLACADLSDSGTGCSGSVGGTSYKVGSFTRDISAASGTQAITGVGFQPKAVLFIGSLNSGATGMVGFDDGTTAGSIVEDTPATAGYFATDQTDSLWGVPAGGTGTGTSSHGHITSFGADGFTITWTKSGSPTGTLTVTYFALK